MSRITAARGSRVYRRDGRGRFATTGSAASAEKVVKTGPSTANKVAKAVGITALSLAGAAAVGTAIGTAIGTEVYHRNTVKIVDNHRSAFEVEQKAADIDRRVAKLIEKHRKRQRIAAGRFI